jgi:WD40 repeat protein
MYGRDLTVREFPAGKISWQVDFSFKSEDASLSPDGRRLAILHCAGSFIELRNADTGDVVWDTLDTYPPSQHGRPGQIGGTLKFSPDGSWIVVFAGRKVRFWDVGTGRPSHEITAEKGGFHHRIAFSADGTKVALGHGHRDGPVVNSVDIWKDVKRRVGLYDVRSGEEVQRLFPERDDLFFMSISPDGKTMVLASKREIFLCNMPAWWYARNAKTGAVDAEG